MAVISCRVAGDTVLSTTASRRWPWSQMAPEVPAVVAHRAPAMPLASRTRPAVGAHPRRRPRGLALAEIPASPPHVSSWRSPHRGRARPDRHPDPGRREQPRCRVHLSGRCRAQHRGVKQHHPDQRRLGLECLLAGARCGWHRRGLAIRGHHPRCRRDHSRKRNHTDRARIVEGGCVDVRHDRSIHALTRDAGQRHCRTHGAKRGRADGGDRAGSPSSARRRESESTSATDGADDDPR